MKLLFEKYKIPAILLLLVLTIAYLSYYNYNTQRKLLHVQMHNNSLDIAGSVTAAIKRFGDIKSTMNLQKLVNDVSFGLEIFEFRYLETNGTIRNSMFKEEIGKIHSNESYAKIMRGDYDLKEFFFEVRDYVDVMAIYYPIYKENEFIGIIDLAVDISEYKVVDNFEDNFSILRRQVDIINLLKSIEGSISNSLAVFAKTDMSNFLNAYVNSAKDILLISLVDSQGKILISNDKERIGKNLDIHNLSDLGLITENGKPIYRTLIKSHLYKSKKDVQLLLVVDASAYANHVNQLLRTAASTTFFALLFALYTTRTIYFSAIEQSQQEKERLEHLVKERTREIELLSRTDALTGLWNRGYLEEMLEMEFKLAKRHKFDISMMIIDLDHFKRVNDTYGHMGGDEVLREISNRIKSCLRETDFVGRYGGEEIVVIFPMTTLETAQKVASTVLKTISAKAVVFKSHEIIVTASIGMSTLRDSHNDHLTVFGEADEVLYLAKERGRNRIEVFTPTEE